MENRTQRWGPVPPISCGQITALSAAWLLEIGNLLIFGLWGPSMGWDGTSEPSSLPLFPEKPAATLN